MIERVWKEIVRISDVMLLTMQGEIVYMLTVMLLLIGCYMMIYPIIHLLIMLEWKMFLSYLLSVGFVFIIASQISGLSISSFFVMAIVLFAICICLSRSITLIRRFLRRT
ncbi:hypothetical protein [Gracilibacillus sp. YIM 98692]|uniref:hypothetical protein n=1 Tax=Gracilibacillus sp. YIM 98692 TaxID=2663532 RepID=UPI0013D3792A|nr:hypothetical protein [Gracilibacillus sp. YIM 98692]